MAVLAARLLLRTGPLNDHPHASVPVDRRPRRHARSGHGRGIDNNALEAMYDDYLVGMRDLSAIAHDYSQQAEDAI
jgi:hypothetical protein